MKTVRLFRSIARLSFLFLVWSACDGSASGQATVHSTSGYDVTIQAMPATIVPHGTGCQYGYNYDVTLSYSTTFSGAGAPGSLYTLQGTVGCGTSSLYFDLPNGSSSGFVTSQSNAWRGESDCGTATIASVGCNEVAIQIEGPGIVSQVVPIPVIALPISLVSFTATAGQGRVDLKWATASESHNDHFTVERSRDASDFTAVLEMPGAGNSTQMLHYSATDDRPYSGVCYYRLKQTDTDGGFTYSPVVVVQVRDDAKELGAFPNPNDKQDFELTRNSVGDDLQILSPTGSVLFSTRLTSNDVDYPILPRGVYIVRVTSSETGMTQQFKLVKP